MSHEKKRKPKEGQLPGLRVGQPGANALFLETREERGHRDTRLLGMVGINRVGGMFGE